MGQLKDGLEWDVCNSQSCHLLVLLTMADKFYVKREQVFHSSVHFHLLFVWSQYKRPRHVHGGYLTYFPKLTKPRKLDKIRSTETEQPAYPSNKGERISEFVNCSEEWGNISVCPLIAQEVLVAVWSHQPLQMNTRLFFVSGSPTAHVVPASHKSWLNLYKIELQNIKLITKYKNTFLRSKTLRFFRDKYSKT